MVTNKCTQFSLNHRAFGCNAGIRTHYTIYGDKYRISISKVCLILDRSEAQRNEMEMIKELSKVHFNITAFSVHSHPRSVEHAKIAPSKMPINLTTI